MYNGQRLGKKLTGQKPQREKKKSGEEMFKGASFSCQLADVFNLMFVLNPC